MSLEDDLRTALNRNSTENGSDTPDFILAEYLIACLDAFDEAVRARTRWYRTDEPEDENTDHD